MYYVCFTVLYNEKLMKSIWIKRQLQIIVLLCLLFIKSDHVYSSDVWLCAGIPNIHRFTIRDLYTGGSYIVNGSWVKMYMLPIDNPLTISIFKQEQIPINLVKRLSSNTSIVDRGYRIVPDIEIMTRSMLSDKPAIGFSYGEEKDVKSCNIID